MEALKAEAVAGFGADNPYGEGPSALASTTAVADAGTEEDADEGEGAVRSPAAATGGPCTTRRRRNSGGDRYEKRFLQSVAAFGNQRGIQEMHTDALLKDLPAALREHDYGRIAGIVSVLMVALGAGYRTNQSKGRPTTVAALKAALSAGLEVLRNHPKACSKDRLRQYLRNMQAAESNPSAAQSLALEVAYLLLESGQAEQAYSIFVNPPPHGTSPEIRFALAAAAGHLQYQRWRQQWEAAGSGGDAGSGAGELAFDELRWARSGRQTQELWREAESALRDAFSMHPASTELAYLLVHLYLCSGRVQQAVEVAVKLQGAAPLDADAHALRILVLEAQLGSQQTADSLCQAYLDLLKCDPSASEAVAGVAALSERWHIPPAVIAHAVCLHLDSCSGLNSRLEPNDGFSPWCILAGVLTKAATKALESASALKALPANALDGHASGIAKHEWEAVVRILRPRAEWWPQLHFRIHGPSTDRMTWLEGEPYLADKGVCASLLVGRSTGFCTAAHRCMLDAQDMDAAERIDSALSLSQRLQEEGLAMSTGSGEGAPYNMVSATYGTVVQLPHTWWRTFPAARRRMRAQLNLGTR